MNDTTVTLVGNVATNVEYRETVAGGVARFRFAVTARRWDRERAVWTDGPTSFYTVSAWRSLGANLAASVSVGEPLVVHGRLKVREEELEGRRKTFVDVQAVAVGHDLTRGTAAFRRSVRQNPETPVPEGRVPNLSPTRSDDPGSAGSGRAPSPSADAGPDPWRTPPTTSPESVDYPLVTTS
ncbi:single-stranded DNA-binding protein [Streptomyces roseicoloratus]|uniref:single-stranded DNA-binding protein n=1 Tax=Streptomyces roseicoloratus TaxID=2508722 RepID=UPI0010098AC8|nr:single-stranded DNA-binding protein [Streptomyces roseicoloratus]